MVETRLQKKKQLLEMAAESQAGSSHGAKDATMAFIEKVLEKMEDLETFWTKEMGLIKKDQEANSKMKEEFDELRTQHEYTDLMCTQLEVRVKEVEEARDQGLAEIVNLKKSLDEARDEIAVLKKAVRHNSDGGVPHVKVKEPKSYDGTRNAKTLGNFLWDMEQYLKRLCLSDDEIKVKIVAQFLTKDAKMWWRRRMDQIANGSADDITSWDEMKKALQTHFSPRDETWEARTKIKYIKQTGSLQAYQREFSSAALELPNMAERDKVFNFIIGLKPWTCNEVKRQKIRTLEEAFAVVDRLVEHYDGTSDDKKKKSDKSKEKKKDDASKADDSSKTKKALKCWICAGPHMVKNCPSKPKVAAIAQSDAKNEGSSVGMMQILGASATTEEVSRRDPERNRLEYVRMKVGGADILTMVDSGASHNFMGEDTVRRIGLKFVPARAQMKTVNSPPIEVLGIAERVDTTLGEWTGKVDFTIVRIDDYEAVLGMEFMKQFDAMIVPHLRKLYIYDGREDVPIGVPTIGVTRPDCKLGVMQVEDEKRMGNMSKRLSTVEAKLTEQSLVIRSLLDIILDLSRRLELVEDDDDDDEVYVRPNVQKEDRVAYLQRMEVEDLDRWIELISEGEPSGSTPSTSS